MKTTATLIILVLLSVFTVYLFYTRRLRKKNKELIEQLREVNRLQSLYDPIVNRHRSPADGSSAIDDNSAAANGNGRKNENIVCLACRRMEDEKLFRDPNLNRKQLADLLGTNENYLAAAIREVNDGQTVGDFINGFRLGYACRLITEFPNMKLEAIANESGFTTRSTLFRLFHKKFGMSPRQYREEHLRELKTT